MATLTIPQKISIAKINEYLISSAILKGNRVIDIELPTKIRIIREGIEYRYNIDPSDDTLTSTSNYMLGMCLYISAALAITGNGGTIAGTTSSNNQGFPIYITQDNFTTATFYPNTRILGNNIVIFLNEINRYLIGTEFSVSGAGITINISGFDATTYDYNLVIEKVYS